VLDALDELGITITFFIVGQDAVLNKNRAALATITARGHDVGNHSFRHEQWFHLFDRNHIAREIRDAQAVIADVTGMRPIGYRGPGFSWSPAVLETLVEENYLYDASTLPTYIGPLARMYYFRTAKLPPEEKEKRKKLFGGLSEGLRPVRAHRMQLNGSTLLEIPVTTIPILKTPFHLSYLLYLYRFSSFLMSSYLGLALGMCRITRTEPSFLLHPLDLMGGDEAPELRFFPGMDIEGKRKREVFVRVMTTLGHHFTLVDMKTHAESLLRRGELKTRRI
jgi:hypothetical protein